MTMHVQGLSCDPPTVIEAGASVGHYAIIYSSDSIMGALVLTPLMLRYWGPKEAKEQAEGADQG